ncbi:hypothetical protein G7085_20400 [Tessaracoccus sp. HDW20]|uniref:hypothetical protein n=1 Tax=Tessaracoccus coleopterorum TaxID=2714950 RepID=UPI0018D29F5A|nr:hypothetical protein [Tessaracoccus coleopterorum]NHB86089.1 hypothetical protein [Tessaracoccus coleopterorum]
MLIGALERVKDCACAEEGRLSCHRCLLPFAARTTARSPPGSPPSGTCAPCWGSTAGSRRWCRRGTSRRPAGAGSDGESWLEERFRAAFLRLAAKLGGTVKQTPSISGGNIITVSLGSRTFRLRPQVHIANSKPDFVLSSEGLPDVAIFTDGWQFHASPKCNNIADDAAKRRILRQGGTLVLAITAQDLALDEAGDAATAPSWFKAPLVQRLNAEPAMQHTAAAREALLGGPLAFLAGWLQQPDPDNLERFARAAAFSVFASGAPGDRSVDELAVGLVSGSGVQTRVWRHGSLTVAVGVPAPGSVRLAAVLDDTVDLTTPRPRRPGASGCGWPTSWRCCPRRSPRSRPARPPRSRQPRWWTSCTVESSSAPSGSPSSRSWRGSRPRCSTSSPR